jgi:hypothetical protein
MLPTSEYAEARMKLFPNAGGDYLPSPWPWKRKRTYICDSCVRAKEDWVPTRQRPDKSLRPTEASTTLRGF